MAENLFALRRTLLHSIDATLSAQLENLPIIAGSRSWWRFLSLAKRNRRILDSYLFFPPLAVGDNRITPSWWSVVTLHNSLIENQKRRATFATRSVVAS